MPGPGEYRPDPSQGITRIEDLPKPKIRCQSRNYRRRPCPRCGQSAYRDRRVRRTLHDLGNPLTGRPRLWSVSVVACTETDPGTSPRSADEASTESC